MTVTLEDIRNLSTEVSALVSAGLPLEKNLADAGEGHNERLQKLTEKISGDLADGKPLAETIRFDNSGASRILNAAVAAGIRSGQLSACIEMMGDLANDLVELRKRILQSITYPLTVVMVGLFLFMVFVSGFLSRTLIVLEDHASTTSDVLVWLIRMNNEFWWWPVLVPVFMLACILFWVVSGRAASMAFRGPERVFLLMPGVSGLIRDLQFYCMTRMFSLLIERQLPLHEALQLAGACSGSRPLDSACTVAAKRAQIGEPPLIDSGNWKSGDLPPLFAASLNQMQSLGEEAFSTNLRGIVDYYRRRLNISLMWLRNVVPVAMFLIIGGGTVALYAFSVFWPVAEIYQQLIPG